jgi:hypothetical protein
MWIRIHITVTVIYLYVVYFQAEGILETRLKAAHRQCAPSEVSYEAFDFHKECSKMR